MRTYNEIITDISLSPKGFDLGTEEVYEKAATQYAKEALDAQLDYLINAGYIKEEDIPKTKSGYFQYLKDTLK